MSISSGNETWLISRYIKLFTMVDSYLINHHWLLIMDIDHYLGEEPLYSLLNE